MKILFSSLHYISNGNRIRGWKPVFVWVLDTLLHYLLVSSEVLEKENTILPPFPLSAASSSLGALGRCSGSPLMIDFKMLPLFPVHTVTPLTHWHRKWFQTPSVKAIGLLFNSLWTMDGVWNSGEALLDSFSCPRHVICQTVQRLTGEGNGNPLQSSCQENPRDRGVWWATVHRVAQSRCLCDWTTIAETYMLQSWVIFLIISSVFFFFLCWINIYIFYLFSSLVIFVLLLRVFQFFPWNSPLIFTVFNVLFFQEFFTVLQLFIL